LSAELTKTHSFSAILPTGHQCQPGY